jgi:hypothetical protein
MGSIHPRLVIGYFGEIGFVQVVLQWQMWGPLRYAKVGSSLSSLLGQLDISVPGSWLWLENCGVSFFRAHYRRFCR